MVWHLKWPLFFNREKNTSFLLSGTWNFPQERSLNVDPTIRCLLSWHILEAQDAAGEISTPCILLLLDLALGSALASLNLRQIHISKLSWHYTMHSWLVHSSMPQGCWIKLPVGKALVHSRSFSFPFLISSPVISSLNSENHILR